MFERLLLKQGEFSQSSVFRSASRALRSWSSVTTLHRIQVEIYWAEIPQNLNQAVRVGTIQRAVTTTFKEKKAANDTVLHDTQFVGIFRVGDPLMRPISELLESDHFLESFKIGGTTISA